MEVKVELEHDRLGVGFLPYFGYEVLAFPPYFDADLQLGKDGSCAKGVETWTMLMVLGNIQTHSA